MLSNRLRLGGEVVLAKMVQTVPREIERRTLSRLFALGARESAMTGAGASRVRWFLVFWLFVLSTVSYLDRVNISIAGGAIAEAYHLSDVQLGKVFSAMLVGYALLQTVGGGRADRFGPRHMLAGGVAVGNLHRSASDVDVT